MLLTSGQYRYFIQHSEDFEGRILTHDEFEQLSDFNVGFAINSEPPVANMAEYGTWKVVQDRITLTENGTYEVIQTNLSTTSCSEEDFYTPSPDANLIIDNQLANLTCFDSS